MATLATSSITPSRCFSSLTPCRTLSGIYGSTILYLNLAAAISAVSEISGTVADVDVVWLVSAISAASTMQGTLSYGDVTFGGESVTFGGDSNVEW